MKILVKIFLFLVAFNTTTYANECKEFITSKDVSNIIYYFNSNKISLKENGSFLDVKSETGKPKEYIYNKIKKHGPIYIFPDKASHRFFMRYLKKIKNDPCSFSDRDINYKFDGKKYIYTLLLDGKKITMRILLHGRYIEEFGFPEKAYMYSFEKIDTHG